jgi:signal transduction histidine kinase
VVEGEPRILPAGADLAAYRIVQEALTNVHRHSAATRATVRVDHRDDSVRVEVSDDGVGRAEGAAPHGSGHGLVGMAERVRMYGGELVVDTAPGAGFRLVADLPLEPVSTHRRLT